MSSATSGPGGAANAPGPEKVPAPELYHQQSADQADPAMVDRDVADELLGRPLERSMLFVLEGRAASDQYSLDDLLREWCEGDPAAADVLREAFDLFIAHRRPGATLVEQCKLARAVRKQVVLDRPLRKAKAALRASRKGGADHA